MSRLSELIRQARQLNPELAADLEEEVRHLESRRAFGLNFERHTPESVELYGRPVRVGDKVRMLVPRASTDKVDQRVWIVTGGSVSDGVTMAHLVDQRTGDIATWPREDLVVVAEHRDVIYPGLDSIARVEKSSEKPFQTVINGENLHALKALLYTHRGKVDVIYIDPPYNTGGKSFWLYNDDYVEGDDLYRHSKWLAFMERRLELAKELLAPTGVLFVSIDDAEQHRLRMLLDQVFGESNFVDTLAVEMSTTSGPKTTNAQQGVIVKNIEFVHIYRRSASFDLVKHTPLLDGIDRWDANYPLWLNEDGTTDSVYRRLDAEPSVRVDIERFGLVHTEGKKTGKFLGSPAMDVLLKCSTAARVFLQSNLHRIGRTDTPPVAARTLDVPVDRWVELTTDDRVYRLTKSRQGKVWQIYTLDRNYRMSDDYAPRFGRTVIRGDLWRGFHSDMAHVSSEGNVAFGNGKKPVRLIRQLIRWANNSPDAVILDFFAGSGTTAHAVMAMNDDDGGCRRSILVTNNELSKEVRVQLERAGHRPGDVEWEVRGVCGSVTIPRLTNVVQQPSSTQNIEVFRLTYEAPMTVSAHRAFGRIAPIMWLKAGSRGRRIDSLPTGWDVAESYGVIERLAALDDFLEALNAHPTARMAFVVTDDERRFQAVCAQLPDGVEPVHLYESYLRNFQIDARRSAL